MHSGKRRPAFLLFFLPLLILALFLKGAVSKSCAQSQKEKLLSTFGEGKVTVRLYTDYFCGPCKAMEPQVEPLLRQLVNENVINLTFIDTPFYRFSALYARYFLYALNGSNRTLDYALSVRNALIEASNKKIESIEKLEGHLESKGIKINKLDPRPIFEAFTRYLQEDRINATPTCVIIRDGKKESYVGGKDIIDALNTLLKKGKE